MRKLKIKLLFSIFGILFLIFVFRFYNSKSLISSSLNYYEGIVTDIHVSDTLSFVLKGREKVMVTYYDNYSLKLGDRARVYGKVSKPSSNRIFYLFNYKKYLLSKRIYYLFKADKIEIISRNKSFKYKIKNYVIDRIEKYKNNSYMKAFILGDTRDIDEESFRNNGISHMLAISGIHIGILSSFLIYVFDKIFKNKNISYGITILLLLFYLFLTSFSPSFFRATLFFVFSYLNKLFDLKIKPIYLLILICLILLCLNPFYIYNLGFLLSFTVSFFIMLSLNVFKNYSNILKSFFISVIAFLSSAPILINSFFNLNFISPIISVLLGPLITFFLYPAILICFFFKPLDLVLDKLFFLLESLSRFIEKIDFLNFTFCHMNITFIIIYYILLILLLYFLSKGKNYLFIFVMIFIIHHNINYFNFSSSVTFIDVGQGDSILLKLKHNKGNILIDTGGIVSFSGKNYDLANNSIIPYLKALGIDYLDYLIITHGDYDHMGEAINLIDNFNVKRVIFNCGNYNDLEKDLLKVLNKKGIKYYRCIKQLDVGKNILYFLQTKEFDNENDNSNVIYINLDGVDFLFMGDASIKTEKEILDNYNLPDIDVLKVGHHGSKTSSSSDFINKTNPKYSIISVGKNNRYGHPNKEVIDNLDDSKIYRTDLDGSIMFKIKNYKIKIETCTP